MPETFNSIGDWWLEKLGPGADPRAVARKMLGEAVELCYAAGCDHRDLIAVLDAEWMSAAAKGNKGPEAFAEELADCVIVGCSGLRTTGSDPQGVVDWKQGKNKVRSWDVRPDGTAQHVPEGE